ncbi:MAG: desulfoferrodoxin FeS4 iron-binding domain-containing protein, partial [Clostridia bacterium]|nr:desulfoferrodoxin FeS4 iron-binding domain-containing protein [Clostridia bacterium]
MSRQIIFYKCSVCGNIVEKVVDSGAEVVCCGKPMEVLKANVTEASTEKHLPVAEIEGHTIKVRIGTV